ncbi:MAG: hypothetical protein ACOX2X_06745 [Peptococcia bacterium]|jgi:hypothetical protein
MEINTNQAPQNETIQNEVMVDDFERQRQEYRNRQCLIRGFLGGVGAAIIGAIIWAVLTVVTGYQNGWMAVGVGFLVGMAIRIMGKGIDISFGIMGAILAFLGCILGNLLAFLIVIAQELGVTVSTVLTMIDLGIISGLMVDTTQPVDLVFYGLAIVEGYKFAINNVVVESTVENTVAE